MILSATIQMFPSWGIWCLSSHFAIFMVSFFSFPYFGVIFSLFIPVACVLSRLDSSLRPMLLISRCCHTCNVVPCKNLVLIFSSVTRNGPSLYRQYSPIDNGIGWVCLDRPRGALAPAVLTARVYWVIDCPLEVVLKYIRGLIFWVEFLIWYDPRSHLCISLVEKYERGLVFL